MGLMLAANLLFAALCLGAVAFFAWLIIRHLKTEVKWLRARVDYYERRGDLALDKMTALTIGQPIAVSHEARIPITAETLEQEVHRLVMGDHEVAHAGQVT